MKKNLLSLVRNSIKKGYLPTDWHGHKQSIVETYDEYLALIDDCALVDGCYYHLDTISQYCCLDTETNEYILFENSILVYSGRDEFFYTHEKIQKDIISIGRNTIRLRA